MHRAEKWINRPPAAIREQQAAGGDEVAVETLKEPKHGHDQYQSDRPTGSQRLFECDRRRESFSNQSLPGSNVSDRSDGEDVETSANEKRHHDRSKKPCRLESWVSFLRDFWCGFESGHEIRHDL